MPIIHHTGIAVSSIEEKMPFYLNALGMKQLTPIIEDPIQKVKVVLVGYSESDQNPPFIELVEPAGSTTPIDRFLKQHISLYHYCIEVSHIDEALQQAKANKAIIVQKPVPAVLFNNRKIAWILTPDRYLIEFLEK